MAWPGNQAGRGDPTCIGWPPVIESVLIITTTTIAPRRHQHLGTLLAGRGRVPTGGLGA
jgi:hypothetical protein